MAIKASLNLDKLRRDVQREMDKYEVKKLPAQEKKFVGEDVVDLMKDQISKGISPIQGWGRFPGYKWVDRGNKALKVARSLKNKARRAQARALGRKLQKGGYPFTAMKRYPGKQVRPVNLFLSGDFLDALESRATSAGVEIGFWDAKFSKYEEGHRTGGVKGVNDQPQRPIIPNESEFFTRNIYQRLVDSVQKRLDMYFAKIK